MSDGFGELVDPKEQRARLEHDQAARRARGLPVYPLDGGQIARELFTLGNPRAGVIQSLQLSAGVAVLVALYAISKGSIYTCAMFGILAYNNFQTLRMYRNHWR